MRLSTLFVSGTSALALSIRQTEQLGNDLERKGNGKYQFVGCDDQQGQAVAVALQTLWRKLRPVIQDAESSRSHRTAAYETFIKASGRAQFVAELITNVTIGNARVDPVPPFSNGSPTFVCVKPNTLNITFSDGTTQDAYDNCHTTNFGASYLYPTPYITLCPVFWRIPAAPPDDLCPIMNRRTNYYRRKKIDDNITGSSVWQNHVWATFHEILHYYLYNTPGYVMLRPEVYSINRAWKLSSKDAWRNSQNIVFFAATSAARCSQWPILPQNERELLETPGNDVADLADNAKAPDRIRGDAINVTSVQFSSSNLTT
ncbi:MAG: hypothetical protein Q9219_006107 [cf. Caloplaca sp. 3 TL-2023]